MTLPSNVKTVADAITHFTTENTGLRAQLAALKGRADVLESKVPAPIAAPVITEIAAIASDGTPQVGEQLTGRDPVGNYPVSARRWLLGSTFLADLKVYTPQAEGDYTYEGTITAPDGRAAISRSTITVTSKTPGPTPQPVTLEPNPIAAPVVVAGVITGLEPVDTKSQACFISGRLLGDGDNAFFAGLKPDGSGTGGMAVLLGNRFQGKTRSASGDITNDFPHYQPFPEANPGYTPFPVTFYMEIGVDKKKRFMMGGKLVYEQDYSSHLENGDVGTFVALFGAGAAKFDSVTYGAVGSGVPLTVRTQSFLSGFIPTANLEYTGSPKRIRVQVEASGGGVLVPFEDVIYDANAKGMVTVRGRTPMPSPATQYGTSPVIRWATFTDDGSKIAEVAKSLVMPDQPATFGWNAQGHSTPYEGFSIYNNLAIQGYYQDMGNHSTDDVGNPPKVNDQRQFSPGPTKSQNDPTGQNNLRATWKQANGVDATWATRVLEGNISYSQPTVTGARQVDFTETFNRDAPKTFGGLNLRSFPAGSPPTDLAIFKIGRDPDALFSPEYIDLQKSLAGPIRWLDPTRTNEKHYEALSFDGRTKVEQRLNWGKDGIPIEWIIALSNITGRDCWWNAPGWYTDDYYTKMFRAFNTGEGLNTTDPNADLWRNGLKPKLKLWVEWGNEVWNFSFSIFTHASQKYCERTGTPNPPYDGSSGTAVFSYGQFEHAFQHNRVMVLLEAAIPNFATRCVRVVGTQAGTDGHYTALKQKGIAHYDAHAQSVYNALDHDDLTGLPDKSPATIKPIFMRKTKEKYDSLLSAYQSTKKDGKRFIAYEGGADLFPVTSGLTEQEVINIKESEEYRDVMSYAFGRWVADYGDLFMHYTDLGSSWGLVFKQGSGKSQGLYAIMAAQSSAKGN